MKSNSVLVSIIIPVHNADAISKLCIQKVVENVVNIDSEIIVVDNDSNQVLSSWLEQQDGLIVLKTPQLMGVSAVYNLALRIATGKYILFMHNDVLLSRDSVRRLISVLEESAQYDAIAPVSSSAWYVNSLSKMEIMPYTDVDSFEASAEKLYRAYNKPVLRDTFILENICMLARREAIDAVGQWDEQFPLRYYEDNDYSYRMICAGFHLGVVDNILVHHLRETFSKEKGIDVAAARQMFADVFSKKWNFQFDYSAFTRKEILQYLNLKKSVAILDIGCGLGANLVEIKNCCPDSTLCGIEIDSGTARVAASFADVRAADLEKLDVTDWQGKFDYIIMGDVIEHLSYPWQALEKVKELLKPKGEIIASIPNILNIETISKLLSGGFRYEKAGVLDRTHLRFFTKREMLKMFEDIGMQAEILHGNKVYCGSNDKREAYNAMIKELAGLKTIQVDPEELDVVQYVIRATVGIS